MGEMAELSIFYSPQADKEMNVHFNMLFKKYMCFASKTALTTDVRPFIYYNVRGANATPLQSSQP